MRLTGTCQAGDSPASGILEAFLHNEKATLAGGLIDLLPELLFRTGEDQPPFGVKASRTLSRLKLAAFWRGGNSLKVMRKLAT